MVAPWMIMTDASSTTDTRREPAALGRALNALHDVHVSDGQRIAHLQAALVEQEAAYVRLEGAITSSRRIGAAVGIVMSVAKVTEDEAFRLISAASQAQNRKVRLIADDIVLTGTF